MLQKQKVTGWFYSTFRLLRAYILSLSDIRRLGILIFTIILLLISWSGLKTIDTNYGLQKQITVLEQQRDVQKLKNENLKLKNQYYSSNQFLELSARQNFGLAVPGEKEVIIPKAVALSFTVNPPKQVADETESAASQLPAYARNLEAWVNFFLHREQLPQ